MKFYSTNNKELRVSFRDALMLGMPSDNGLFMPENIPDHSNLVQGINELSFQDIAYVIAKSILLEDFKNSEIEDIISTSISFDSPIVNIDSNINILELFHGPTLAFKDFGARFMARTMEKVVSNNDREINILVATSGDTGSAVANGFYDVEGINVIILYPSNKVSYIQEKQLTTFDKNIYALEIKGTFDDCQNLVKQAFLDDSLKSHLDLSSANSINIARLIPQSFYYFNAYAKLNSDKEVVVSVPSGNFGNITAGILAKQMGLPIKKFIASTNVNKTVPEFLRTSKYISSKSIDTISNAMDVGNPSNMKRIMDIYHDLKNLKKHLIAFSFDDEKTKKCIYDTWFLHNYLLDPHSAVGLLGLKHFLRLNLKYNGIFLGTAHPAKFSDVIEPIINKKVNMPENLSNIINKEKNATLLNNDYKDFSDYLLTNFK